MMSSNVLKITNVFLQSNSVYLCHFNVNDNYCYADI